MFFINSFLLGFSLSMDAFSLSIVNGITVKNITAQKTLVIAWVFGAYQFTMPLVGWTLVHYALSLFGSVEPFIPWVALALLLFIGIKMIEDGRKEIKKRQSCETYRGETNNLTARLLLLQGLATSIDALSVGLTISDYGLTEGLLASIIIGTTTFAISIAGVVIGRKFGPKLSYKAPFIGGAMLIIIGLEIWARGVFFSSLP